MVEGLHLPFAGIGNLMKSAVITAKIKSKNQWLTELARMSKVIRDLNLAAAKDVAYVEYVTGKSIFDQPDA
jgi:hypothetical protein